MSLHDDMECPMDEILWRSQIIAWSIASRCSTEENRSSQWGKDRCSNLYVGIWIIRTSETTIPRVKLYDRLLKIINISCTGQLFFISRLSIIEAFFKEGDKMTNFYQPVLNQLHSCYCILFLSLIIIRIILLFWLSAAKLSTNGWSNNVTNGSAVWKKSWPPRRNDNKKIIRLSSYNS